MGVFEIGMAILLSIYELLASSYYIYNMVATRLSRTFLRNFLGDDFEWHTAN